MIVCIIISDIVWGIQISDCGRYVLFPGPASKSVHKINSTPYITTKAILQEPRENLYESSITKYGYAGYYGEYDSS